MPAGILKKPMQLYAVMVLIFWLLKFSSRNEDLDIKPLYVEKSKKMDNKLQKEFITARNTLSVKISSVKREEN